METIKLNDLTIEISQDEFAESSREWDNVGAMACWHRSYILGDEQPNCSPEDYLRGLMYDRELNLRGKHVPEDIETSHVSRYVDKHFVVVPLYLYDHSGISMSASLFSCGWDSGCVGFIYAELGDNDRAELLSILLSEVSTYNQYLTGEVYQYLIRYDNEHVFASCGGFYGFDDCKEGALAEAKVIAEELETSFAI
jgi:hypothetical protein